MQVKYIIITPVRDEAAHIDKTFAAVSEQTILPARWIIVDDGSTDGTGPMLDAYAAERDWITVIHRPNRGHRAAGGGVMEAFYAGYAVLGEQDWDYIVKLDGDLSFGTNYFEQIFQAFEAESRLGIAGGTVCQLDNGQLRVDSVGDPPFHVRGATKVYRRKCWEVISPLVKAPGWDTLDEVKANFNGWTTRTLNDVRLIQHKPTGAADGDWRNAFKNGRANYLTGYHPAFMLAKCLRRLFKAPFFIESAALLAGYCSCYLKRTPPAADEAVIRYLRQQQVRRLLLRPSIYD